ncbi:MAG: type III polyketide synthase [Candidatus Eiseniibacteriota bacterium]
MALAPQLAGLGTALPSHTVPQSRCRELAGALFGPAFAAEGSRLLAVFDSVGIEQRHISMPLEWYGHAHDLGEANAIYIERALELSASAAISALERAGLSSLDVDHIVLVSSTGIATPSLDARLANLLPLRGNVRRSPLWGLGCAGGASGMARARDYALADPSACVLLIAVELCSLTFQHGDLTRQNLVAASLFSDGAAAAVVLGAASPLRTRGAGGSTRRLELKASRSRLWPETLDVMGWNVDRHGLHVVFSRDIPTIVREWVRPELEQFLADHELSLASLDHVVAHPGGPKVLAAYAEALGLPGEAFRHAYAVLRDCGNMSAPTCLFVLERALASGEIGAGQHAVLAALGPGFSSELVLMRGAD